LILDVQSGFVKTPGSFSREMPHGWRVRRAR